MKLQTWTPVSTPRFIGVKAIISAFKTGRIGFSTKAMNNLSLYTGESKSLVFHQDQETSIWYLSISDTDVEGFAISKNAAIQSKFIAHKMLLEGQDKCRFLLGESIEHEGKTLYELIRLDRNE